MITTCTAHGCSVLTIGSRCVEHDRPCGPHLRPGKTVPNASARTDAWIVATGDVLSLPDVEEIVGFATKADAVQLKGIAGDILVHRILESRL